jgi:hypothetical protein
MEHAMPDEAPNYESMSADQLRAEIEHLDGDIAMETGDPGAGQLDTSKGLTRLLGFGGLAGRDVDALKAKRAALQAELDSRFDPVPPSSSPLDSDESESSGDLDRVEIGGPDEERVEIGGPEEPLTVMPSGTLFSPSELAELERAAQRPPDVPPNAPPAADTSGDGLSDIVSPSGTSTSAGSEERDAKAANDFWRHFVFRVPPKAPVIGAGLFVAAALVLGALQLAKVPRAAAPTIVATVAVNAGSAASTARNALLSGRGSVSFVLPPAYQSNGPVVITDYICMNGFLPPLSGGAEEPAMGMRGTLSGHTFQALFSAKSTNVIFENVSRTPAMSGGPPPTFELGKRAAGTVSIQTPGGAPGTVTLDLTCEVAGPH